MKILKFLEHAKYNEKACNFINTSSTNEFNDWVIIIAFYSAVHYIHYKILPFKGKVPTGQNKTINDFGTLHSYFQIGEKESPHKFRERWVRNFHSDIHSYYKVMFDDCYTARYKDYQFSNDTAYFARKRLKETKN
jgi:hypothetical protein